jgi:hypothetical protein
MELALTLLGLGGLYVITNQNDKNPTPANTEGFSSKDDAGLPNTDIPDKNYPDTAVIKTDYDITSRLGTVNRYETINNAAYTDKYFDQSSGVSKTKMTEATNTTTSNTLYKSMLGTNVNQDYFEHNNMVPYFGSSVRGGTSNANRYESTLDNYVGAGSQTITKSEQSPLFKPSEHYQYMNGAPNMTDFYQSRMVKSQNMAGVKPFESQNVGPGLGLGYTAEGQGGFNSGMEHREYWQPKTVDQLRVASNPKPTEFGLLGYEGAPQHYVTQSGNRDTFGKVEKNRPDTTFEIGAERYFTTTGVEIAPPMKPKIIEKHINRPETSTDYAGIARGSNTTYMPGEYMEPKTQQLGEVPFTAPAAQGKYIATESDYGMNSGTAYPNNRSYNSPTAGGENYFAGVSTGGFIGAVVAPLLDLLRPTRKENTVGNLRPYENAKTRVSNTYIYNPADRPATTIREMTEISPEHHNVHPYQHGGAYMTAADAQYLDDTNRMTTSIQYSGNANSYAHAERNYDAEYNQRNNDMKTATIAGYTPTGNMSLFNSTINPTVLRNDNSKNTRELAANRGVVIPPSGDNYGQMSGTQTNIVSNIGYQRNTAEVMGDVLQKNPYAASYYGVN